MKQMPSATDAGSPMKQMPSVKPKPSATIHDMRLASATCDVQIKRSALNKSIRSARVPRGEKKSPAPPGGGVKMSQSFSFETGARNKTNFRELPKTFFGP